MITAVLDLNVGARARREALQQMVCRFAHRHNVVDQDLFGVARRQRGECFRLHLFRIADHMVDFRHRGKNLRVQLRRATSHDDGRVGIIAPRLADGLARLAHRFACHRTGVDDDSRSQPGARAMLAHDFRLVGIQAAAECEDLRSAHWTGSGVSKAGSSVPS